MFDKCVFDEGKLLETKITMAWAAACTLCDLGWLQDFIDSGHKTVTPTKLLSQMFSEDKCKKAKPFKSTDVCGNSQDTLHNIESLIQKTCKIKIKSKEVIEPA